MNDPLLAIIQAALILGLAPLVTGIIRKVKALLQSRRGPPILQSYYDLQKLFRKSSVVSSDASWISTITPYVCMATMVVAALLVPVFITASFGSLGDLIVVVYLFATSRFFMALVTCCR